MDVPAAPAIVLERPAPCRDVAKADEILKRTLAPALAPRGSWTVFARFSRKGGSLVVEGEITDDVDAPVAHRVLTDTGAECSPLARAVGVWASLVLDSELERAAHVQQTPPPTPIPPEPPAPPDRPSPEGPIVLSGPDKIGDLDLGLSMTLMAGMGSGVIAGPTLYAVLATGKDWYIRPALFVDRSLEELVTTSDVYGTLVATRFDACRRFSGFHVRRIQLDACGGVELGFMHFDAPSVPEGVSASNRTLPFLGVGPSVSLRGELGEGLAVVLRAVANLNVVPEGFSETIEGRSLDVHPSLVLGRLELGLSWQPR